MKWLLALLLVAVSTVQAEQYPSDLIARLLVGSRGLDRPTLPTPPESLRALASNEMATNAEIKQAFSLLDPKGSNTSWFEGVAALEKSKAVWCLQIALCHPHPDVQIEALRALRELGDKRAVAFTALYSYYMAEFVVGSESATLHMIIHQEVTTTLCSLTGINIPSPERRGQDPEGLKRNCKLWMKWVLDNQPEAFQ